MRLTSGQPLWRFTFSFSLISLLLFAAGFFFSMDPALLRTSPLGAPASEQRSEQPTTPLPPDGQLKVVTLGDSLTRGAGDANGVGYVGLVKEALEKRRGTPPMLTNLAINGLESTGLLEQLKQTQVKQAVADADLILFTIGGNDLFRQSGGVYDLDEKKLAAAMSGLATNYKQILSQIRSLNKNAPIVYTSLYNPFGDTEASVDTIQPVLSWNSKAAELASRYPKVIVVPTYDLFINKEKAYLYSDHFHPNQAGYRRIADRIIQALE